MKKVLSILLCLCMLFAMASMVALPAYGGAGDLTAGSLPYGDFTYKEMTEGKITITGYTGDGGAVTIPSQIDGKPVAGIHFNTFSGCTTLTSIVIPETVGSIGWNVFSGCSELTTVIAPGVTFFGQGAFGGCSKLSDVTFGDAKEIKEIGHYAFSGCISLESVPFGENIKTISEQAFNGCTGLTSVVFPDGIDYIGAGAFANCTALSDIVLPDQAISIGEGAFDNTAYYNNAENWDNNVFYIGKHLIRANENFNLEEYTIKPGTLTIGGGAFENKDSLESVTIPAGVQAIGASAFESCSLLETLELPNTVTEIGVFAFKGTHCLTEITIPSSVKKLGSSAFSWSGLERVVIEKDIPEWDTEVFMGCGALTDIAFPSEMAMIPEQTFRNCSALAQITLPDCGISIGYEAFCETAYYNDSNNWENGLLYIGKHLIARDSQREETEYTIKPGTLSIGAYAFGWSGLKSIVIPEGVEVIGSSAFAGCALKILEIPSTVVEIGESAFYSNNILDEIVIPAGVKKIGAAAFGSCGLKRVELNGNISDWGESVFIFCSQLEEVVISSNVTSIGEEAFYICDALNSVTIPANLVSIGDHAFGYANGLIKRDDFTIYGDLDTVAEEYATVNGFKFIGLNCDHIWNEGTVTVSPTCVAEGVKIYQCTKCTETKTETVAATGAHVSGPWSVVEPTYFKEGSKTATCITCPKIFSEVIAKKTVPAVDSSAVFADVSVKNWFYDKVNFAYSSGLYKGTSATSFSPNQSMTRGMFVTVLGRLAGVEVDHKVTTKFSDVKSGQYYTGYVKWANEAGIVNGTSGTTFDPNANVTREQICKMMVEYCRYAGIRLKEVNAPVQFNDDNKISGWAKDYVYSCQKAGLINGKGGNIFDPLNKATRAEVATIFYNFNLNY